MLILLTHDYSTRLKSRNNAKLSANKLHKQWQNHRYWKSKIDCLRFVMCPLLARSFKTSFTFLWWPLTVLMKQTRQAVRTFKQSILLRCLHERENIQKVIPGSLLSLRCFDNEPDLGSAFFSFFLLNFWTPSIYRLAILFYVIFCFIHFWTEFLAPKWHQIIV